jgi:hypothetical protein
MLAFIGVIFGVLTVIPFSGAGKPNFLHRDRMDHAVHLTFLWLTFAAPNLRYYPNDNPAAHQGHLNSASADGYHLASLSLYGSRGSETYATVWLQEVWPAWKEIHGVNAADYQTWFDQNTSPSQGYVPTLISALGPLNNAVYASVVEKLPGVSFQQTCEMTPQQFLDNSANHYNNHMIMKSFTEYGTADDRRYCAIWHSNPNNEKWVWDKSLTYADYQTLFDSQTTKPYWRPAYLSVSGDQKITALFTDTDVGTWQTAHGMDLATFMSKQSSMSAAGLQLTHLQAGGYGSSARYAALWSSLGRPGARQWRVNGATSGFKNNDDATTQVDNLLKSFMQTTGVRQAQIAIGKNGNILMERAYSWSEPTRATTKTSDVFLLASVSKMFCEAAIQSLFDAGKLKPSQKVFQLSGLPWQGSSPPLDSRINDITVQQLLDHNAGFDRNATGSPGDVIFEMRQISQTLSGHPPPSIQDFVWYMRGLKLDYTPGTAPLKGIYSNVGYVILSAVVESVSGQKYFDYLTSHVVATNEDVKIWHTDPSYHVGDAITQESSNVGLSALHPDSNALVANIFGGDGMYKETTLGSSCLAASATSLVRFLHNHGKYFISLLLLDVSSHISQLLGAMEATVVHG